MRAAPSSSSRAREIWNAVCACVQEALSQARGVDPTSVAGIGFDATCSLVVLGEGGKPLPVGPSEQIRSATSSSGWTTAPCSRPSASTRLGHEVLKYVGGRISPEMETPKLLWLLENRPDVFDAAWQFFDLTDFLTWRATGDLSRSTCTVTCKWTYLAHEQRWDDELFPRASASACWRTRALRASARASSNRGRRWERTDRRRRRGARPAGRNAGRRRA